MVVLLVAILLGMGVLVTVAPLAFVVWYDTTAGVVVVVNGVSLTRDDIRRYSGGVAVMEGRTLGPQAARWGAVRREVLRQEAERVGIIATNKEIAQAILHGPFRSPDGTFDTARYGAACRAAGLTKEELEDHLRIALMVHELLDGGDADELRASLFESAELSWMEGEPSGGLVSQPPQTRSR